MILKGTRIFGAFFDCYLHHKSMLSEHMNVTQLAFAPAKYSPLLFVGTSVQKDKQIFKADINSSST